MALIASASLAACGGGGGGDAPSALDPANKIPATAILYASVTVKPQGSVKSNLTQAIDSVAGKGSARRLNAKLDKSLSKTLRQVRGWAGQRIGIALTGWPSNVSGLADAQALLDDVVIVVPTNDPSAASSFLTRKFNGPDEMGKVVGHYVIFGGQVAVSQALMTTAKTSLADDAHYKADMAQLGGGELFSFYAPTHQLLEAVLPMLRSATQASGDQTSASQLGTALKDAPPGSTAAYGLSTKANEFRLDVVQQGLPKKAPAATAVPSDVSSLPSGAWLALALSGSLANKSAMSSLTKTLPQAIAEIRAASSAAGQVPSAPLNFLEKDLLPALGPMSLAVSGTSESSLQAGLEIAPLNQSAGARLAAGVKQLVRGLPIVASTVGSRVLVTFGYKSVQQFLNPSAHLSGDPVFKSALGQLPAGAKAALYVNFGPIGMFSSLDHSAGDASGWRVVHRLNYLIAGGTHTHFRVVLATR